MGKKDKNDNKKKLAKEDMNYLLEHTKYNKNELKDWYKRFLEECPQGVLRKDDLQAMYGKISPKEDPTLFITHLFRIFDRDNNGSIDFKEYVLATDITTSNDPEEKLRWTFKMYDKDGSGTIEMAEMIEILETVYVMEGVMTGNMAKLRAKQIFQELDINGDGSLTCDEFVKGCMKDKDFVDMLKRGSANSNEDDEAVSETKAKKSSGTSKSNHARRRATSIKK